MSNKSSLTGPLPAALANDVSDAIHRALKMGMAVDEACCVVVAVAADYARDSYGDAYLLGLASVVAGQAGRPNPARRQ